MKTNNKLKFKTLLSVALISFSLWSFTSCKKEKIDEDDKGVVSENAILYTGRYSTPDGRKFFMGAFPTVPTSNPDISKLTELSGTNVATFTYNGFVYSWDGGASEMTKWKVENNLKLTKLDVLSFANTGISGNNFGAAFFSDTEAYLPGLSQSKVVKWNPTTMTLTETINVSSPNTTYNFWNWRTYISGNNIVIPLELGDWDNLETEPKVMVGIFNTQTKSITYAEDSRAQANNYMFPVENGDLYSYPSSTSSYFQQYGTKKEYPRSGGMVRIKNGANSFDPDFYVNVMEYTHGANAMGMFYVGNNKWLVKQYADTLDYPSAQNIDDFWTKELEFKLFDHVTKTSVNFPGKAKGYSGNNGWFVVDGLNYHQSPNRVTGNTEVVIISEAGWNKVFEIEGGDVNQLARIR